ncbi:MAG: PAS:GGDEF:response regulator receiver [Candidatus Scalindua rubra]|uniref:diguanylate cyclase n=1 Tax=Candidatus Scalindua rubra TaxID=1872076 RepID=A0A1E3XBS5_9BACT|nr:MAG: PAS:GGDEF:response regulator receiver [Candidatus Scalindua rubra]
MKNLGIEFDSLVNSLPEMVFSTDYKRNLLQINKLMLEKLGYSHQELTNMRVDDLIPKKDIHAIKRHYIKILNGFSSCVETKISTKANSYIDVELVSACKKTDNMVVNSGELQKAGDTGYVITIAKDVSLKKILEKEVYNKNKELEGLAITDKLTGLYNRIYFDAFIEHEIRKSKRYMRPLSIAKIDLDKFKLFNYKFGNREGDNVLKELGLSIKKSIRDDIDTAYRYGGGEFMIIFPETPTKDALIVSERLRKSFSQVKFSPQALSGKTISVNNTISMGIAGLSKDDDKDSLIRKADEALYTSKMSGGNKISA